MSAEQDRDPALSHASTPVGAVFLSYASQDAEAARKICDALRAAGIEVWFDQSELRGGDAWDHSIRKQIKTCALFIPVISRHTHDRDEGYFRLEWSLAVDRCRLMAADRAFLLPVVVDDTRDDDERVPERFREVQWTRLPGGNTPPAFLERVKRLLAPQPSTASRPASSAMQSAPTIRESIRPSWWSKPATRAIVATLGSGLVSFVAYKFWSPKHVAEAPPVTTTVPATAPTTTAAVFSPPPHSIAVLPFVNMSGDKQQEYFSDGLSEELLNDLARINELQVAARTSAFSFKGKDTDIGTIARKLNVGSVLEGSVRRSGHKIRITAQLDNAVTGFHLWSQTYDRDLGDVLQLQTEIATAVAAALKVTLLGDAAAKIELGGTRNPAAFDAYLLGMKARTGAKGVHDSLAAYTEAIHLDPNYALAFAYRSLTYSVYAGAFATGSAIRESYDKALADAHRAIALAPELAEGHLALARLSEGTLDFAQASGPYERAQTLAPGNAEVLRLSGRFAVYIGHFEPGLTALRRAAVLDPLNPRSYGLLSQGLYFARRYQEAAAAATDGLSLESDYQSASGERGLADYEIGELERARASCEANPDHWITQQCLAVTYDKLGRHADAEAAVAKMKASMGDDAAYQYAGIYAQWGNTPQALEWLDTAMRLRDSGLVELKADPLMDPLRNEPRFQAIERQLKFPE